MTTRPVRSIIDDQLDDLVMPAGADIAAVLGLPRETLVVNLPRRMAVTIKKGRKCLGGAPWLSQSRSSTSLSTNRRT
ncbi:hypothetical protein N5K55_06030 [Pseudomonas aeruginosa]|nr:hypothetical protein [Pseudomonas aeruginosa]